MAIIIPLFAGTTVGAYFLFKKSKIKSEPLKIFLGCFIALAVAALPTLIFVFTADYAEIRHHHIPQRTNQYNGAFEETILAFPDGDNSALEYNNQTQLLTYVRTHVQEEKIVGTWSCYLVGKSRISQTPEDLGAIVVIDQRVLQAIESYDGEFVARFLSEEVTLLDPYTNTVIANSVFVPERELPSSINENMTFYPVRTDMIKWIESQWASYLAKNA